MRYFLLILFLGYYGSVTLFTHTHIINGAVIVHSHPYNPFAKQSTSSNHQHSTKALQNIKILSYFLTTIIPFIFIIEVYKTIFRKYILNKNDKNFSKEFNICFNGLRAPPLNIYN
jgi:hypothetical protein